MTCELRLGRYQDVLADVERVDAIICDPPYSERTHAGASTDGQCGTPHALITYPSWSGIDVTEFVTSWAPRVTNWLLAMTDHVLAPQWATSLEEVGMYVFAPVPFVRWSGPRMMGDGPASGCDWIIVARHKRKDLARWGSLRGAYVLPRGQYEETDRKGGKPEWLMRALVRDYSRPGDLVCDPCAGGATTLHAARIEGRRAIGAEMDPETYAKAQKRLARGYTPTMFVE